MVLRGEKALGEVFEERQEGKHLRSVPTVGVAQAGGSHPWAEAGYPVPAN